MRVYNLSDEQHWEAARMLKAFRMTPLGQKYTLGLAFLTIMRDLGWSEKYNNLDEQQIIKIHDQIDLRNDEKVQFGYRLSATRHLLAAGRLKDFLDDPQHSKYTMGLAFTTVMRELGWSTNINVYDEQKIIQTYHDLKKREGTE